MANKNYLSGGIILKPPLMMKMNTWAWIGIGGGIAGLLIGVVSVLTTSPGSTGIYIAAGILAFFGGMFFLFYKLLFGPMLNASRLQKTGISGKAIITAVNDTGVTVNNNPQVKLTLEIKNSFGQRYTTTCRTLVSRINPFAYQPGMEVPVKIDPKDEKNVVIDFTGNNTSTNSSSTNQSYSQADVTNLTAELETLQQEHNAIKLSGRAARAIIKKYTWLGTYVNGTNPYAEIELEVLPEASPAFSGKTRGVIAETSVEKYQPGKVIFVKYDFYDNSKIVIDHS
jgi:ribosomal protein L31